MTPNMAKKIAEAHNVGLWWDSSAQEWVVSEPFEAGCEHKRLSSGALRDASDDDFVRCYIEPVTQAAHEARQQRRANEAAFFGRDRSEINAPLKGRV